MVWLKTGLPDYTGMATGNRPLTASPFINSDSITTDKNDVQVALLLIHQLMMPLKAS